MITLLGVGQPNNKIPIIDAKYQGVLRSGAEVYRSEDFGTSFSMINISDVFGTWTNLAISGDGKYWLAVTGNYIALSNDFAVTWELRDVVSNSFGCAVSQDGKYQSFCGAGLGIYVSDNFGVSFNLIPNTANWKSISMSASGRFQTAIAQGSQIWVSNDFGATFNVKGLTNTYLSGAMSQNGQYQLAVGFNERIYTSSNFGQNWVARDVSAQYYGCAISGDGKYMVAGGLTGTFIRYSDNFGVTWSNKDAVRNWNFFAISSDGKYMLATTNQTQTAFQSTDFGLTWNPILNSQRGYGVAINNQYESLIPIENIISYYKFENNVLDSVGTNNGTPTNITYATGKVGLASVYNGTNSSIVIPYSSTLNFTNGVNDLPFSISMFINSDTNNIANRWLINQRTDGNEQWQVMYFEGELQFWLFDKNFSVGGDSFYMGIAQTYTLTIGEWVHLTVTYDGSKLDSGIKMYINGVSVGTQFTQGEYTGQRNGTAPVTIGRFGWVLASTGWFDGKIDETIIWNKALTQEEVTEIYDLENAGLPIIL